MVKKGNSAAGPFLALVFISLIWGYNWVVMKETLRYAGPFDFNALRMALGSVFLFASMAWKREPLRPPFPVWTAILGVVQTALGTGLI
ncbi:EamA family transporter, partial [bacterium]|nr:EamA family transporter [bacterium]